METAGQQQVKLINDNETGKVKGSRDMSQNKMGNITRETLTKKQGDYN